MRFCSTEFVYGKTLFWILAILRWNVLWPRADPQNIKFLVEKKKKNCDNTSDNYDGLFPIQIIHLLLATTKIRLESQRFDIFLIKCYLSIFYLNRAPFGFTFIIVE